MNPTLKIALVQSQLHWEDSEANRGMFSEKIKSMPDDVEMAILPEMFSTGFTMTPQQSIGPSEGKKTVEWMQSMAKEKNMAIVGSIIFTENRKNYNRLFFVYPDGEAKSYDKRHTFALAGEDQVYEAGKDKLILEYKGFKICPLVCYDLRFPVWSRNVENYDALVYVANWPRPRIDAWDALLKARAIENMAYCIGVNRIGVDELGYDYPGHSSVFDVLGNRIAYTEKEEILYVTLEKYHVDNVRDKLKFLEDRDDFNLI